MPITLNPTKKLIAVACLVITFLSIAHFILVPKLGWLTHIQPSPLFRILLICSLLIIGFGVITYANMFRPLVPGKSTWQQEKFLKPLKIDNSKSGFFQSIYLILKVLLFSIVLYGVLSYTIHLYIVNIPSILNGTYEFDKMEAAFMGAPVIALIMFLLFLGVRFFDREQKVE